MAELINEIISPEAFKQVADMKAELASLTKQMEDMLKAMGKASTATGKGSFGGVPDEVKRTAEEMKQLQIVKNKIITTEAKLNDEYVQQAARLKELNSELRANVAQTGLAEGSLDQMRNNLNKLEKLYSAMSAEMRNAKVGQTIFADMVKAKEGVTLLEQSMGNYKRNVGNYANSTFQLTQTLRELPAFAFSAQTGLMGISNNLPLLADAFSKVKQETGSTMGAIKVFGASLFSFSNIFAVAIGLSTIFLPKLIEWASGTKEVDEATKKLAESIGKETAKFEALTRGLNDVTLSEKERLNIAKELKDLYPTILANYSAEEIAAGKAAKAINQIKDALIGVAMARAAEEDLAKLAQQRYENEKKIADAKVQQANAEAAATRLTVASENAIGNAQDRTIKASIAQQKASEDAKNTIVELTKANADLDAQMSKVANSINKYRPAIQSIADATGTSNAKTPKTAIEKRAKENVTELEIIPAFKYQKMDKAKIGDNGIDEVMKRLQEQISKTPVTITVDFNAKEKLEIFAQKAVPILEQIQKITQESTQAIGDLTASFTARKMQDLDMEQKKMQEKFDAEKTAIDQLSISQEEKTKRITALEAQRAAQQKKIDAERLQAARKQAGIDKMMNISNIITTTAVAVMKALAMTPPNIPLAIANGAIGSAQLAAAIAAPLPQFAKGTDNAPEGFAVVGERGTELVVNPDGTSWLTPAKDTITYLKQGAKVIPNNELMDMVKYANYVNVGGIKQGETGGLFGMALVSKFDELADEVRGLKMIMANKNMNVQVSGNYDHYLHVRKNIR